MRILQINASYKPAYVYGGPTISVSELSEQLAKAGNSISVFTTTANGNQELEVEANSTVVLNGVAITYFERKTKDHSHLSPKLLAAVNAQAKQFDVVHIHAWWNLVSVLSCFIALAKGAKVIVSPRGTLSGYSFKHKGHFIKNVFHKIIGRKLLNKCFIHVTSANEQTELSEIIDPKKYFNIANFISLPNVKNVIPQIENDILKLLFLSRIDEKKGLDVLISALALVNIPWSLSIAGDGDPAYIEELKKLAHSKGIDQHIKWLGFRQADKFDIYRDHDLFVLPSQNENFGNVVIESLSVGTPVLVSKHVGLADFVAKHNAGWVFELNPDALKEAIQLASSQKEKIAFIKKSGRQLVEGHFGRQVLTEQYLAMYNEIAGNDGL